MRFRVQLSRYQVEKQKWSLIENFSKLVQKGREDAVLKTFEPVHDLSPEKVDTIQGHRCK